MKDKRIDDYIAKSAEFAKPILTELRQRMHSSVPGVAETIKWSMPHFEYKGKMFAGGSPRRCSSLPKASRCTGSTQARPRPARAG